jgi:hypothetical protein
MSRPMYPFSQAELDKMAASAESSQAEPARKPWARRGFFKDSKRMARRQVALKAQNARLWLQVLLHDGPKPATEVLRLARLEGVPESGLWRAKYHYGVKSVKRGGRQGGYGAVWYWQFPVSI